MHTEKRKNKTELKHLATENQGLNVQAISFIDTLPFSQAVNSSFFKSKVSPPAPGCLAVSAQWLLGIPLCL